MATRGPKLTLAQRKSILTALTEGSKSPTELAAEFGVTVQAITPYVKRVESDVSREVDTAVIAAASDEQLEAKALSDRAWLESFRNNPKLPASERVRAAIALERSSSKVAEQEFELPKDPREWAQVIFDMIEAQPEAVLTLVEELLAGRGGKRPNTRGARGTAPNTEGPPGPGGGASAPPQLNPAA